VSERVICKHGSLAGVGCAECQREAAKLYGKFELRPTALDAHEPVGDARAQLWARVYGDEVKRLRDEGEDAHAREWACQAALAAVEDFDERYLGGRR
jgi:hypothetical protein